MKYCPVCKTAYTDDSLAFCLSDGARLSAAPEIAATQVLPADKMRMQIPVGSDFQSDPTIVSAAQNSSKKKRKSLIYVLAATGFLILVLFVVPFGILFYKKDNSDKKDVAGKNIAPSPVSSQTPVANENNTEELKNRLANLEKQLDERKNASPSVTPFSNSSNPLTEIKTAKVDSTNDGFLALRTVPDTKSGEQILKIPSGSIVQVGNCRQEILKYNGHSGQWCLVTYNGQAGWAFDGWLIY